MNNIDRDFPVSQHVSPSEWLGDWNLFNYRDAVRASRSTEPEQLVRAVVSAAHSTWNNRELIINRAVRNPNFPPVLASFAYRYWERPFTRR